MSAKILLSLVIAWAAIASLARAEKLSNREIYNKAVRGTVFIAGGTKDRPSSGTGWIVDAKQKLIVTNYHVAPGTEAAIHYPKFIDGKANPNRRDYTSKGIRGKILDSDPKIDLAIIQVDEIPEGMHELPLASEEAMPGDHLHLVGNPGASRGLWVYTTGTLRQMVNYNSRLRDGQSIEARVGENQMSINGGDSGSAVLNDDAEVVGINFAANMNPEVKNFCFYIAVSELKALLGDVRGLLASEKTASLHERRAERHIRKGNREEALTDLNHAIELDAKLGTAYRQRARLKQGKGLTDSALNDLYKAVALLPEEGAVYNERAIAHYRRGDLKRAIVDYNKALELMPEDAVVYVNRGLAYVGTNESAQAMKDFDRALELDSRSDYALKNRARLLRQQKEYTRAIADFRAALREIPNDSAMLFDLAETFQANRDLAQAAETYSQTLKAKPTNPATVWQRLGEVRHTLGQHDEALAAFSEAIKLAPNEAMNWASRGRSKEAKGETDEAQADYQKAIELSPAFERLLPRHTARQVMVTNNTAEALEVFARYSEPGTGKPSELIKWTINAGSNVRLTVEEKPIEASRLRIWAVGAKTGKKFDLLKNRDIVLVEGSYRGLKMDTHVHRFGD